MNWGSTPVYQGLTGVGLQFKDLTIALPNTIVGSAITGVDYFGGLAKGFTPTVQRFTNQGMLVSGGLISSNLGSGTLAMAVGGPYVLGSGEFNPLLYRASGGQLGLTDIMHEFIHVNQQRTWGPLQPIAYKANEISNALRVQKLSGGLLNYGEASRVGYWSIGFEKAAYAGESNLLNLIKTGNIFGSF